MLLRAFFNKYLEEETTDKTIANIDRLIISARKKDAHLILADAYV